MRSGEDHNQSQYTTIPISPADVISRSLHNLSAAAAHRRVWPEFLGAGGGTVDRPHSLSDALDRLRKNFRRFRVNYAYITAVGGAVSLIGAPVALLAAVGVVALWLVLYFFREDPLVVSGYQISDRALLLGLVLVTIATAWFSGIGRNLLIGTGVGVAVCGLHGVLMNPEGFYLNENEATSANLIQPNATS